MDQGTILKSKIAEELHKLSEKEQLTDEIIECHLTESVQQTEEPKTIAIPIENKKLSSLLDDIDPSEHADYIIKAIEFYKENTNKISPEKIDNDSD